ALADHLERSPEVAEALGKAIRALLTWDWSAVRLSHALSDIDARSWPAQLRREGDRALEEAKSNLTPDVGITPSVPTAEASALPAVPAPTSAQSRDTLPDYK